MPSLSPQTQNCLSVNLVASLLAGFAWDGLTQISIPIAAPYLVKLAYIWTTSAAMCFELLAVLGTTLIAIMGPGLALCGPDGSVHPAVEGMLVEHREAFRFFVLGIIFFHVLSSCLDGPPKPQSCTEARPRADHAEKPSPRPADTAVGAWH